MTSLCKLHLVIWGYKDNDVARTAKADMHAVIVELQGNWTRRWEAIGMLKYLFSCTNVPWELKQHGISFLLCLMDSSVERSYDDCDDYSIYIPTLYASLQVLYFHFQGTFIKLII